MAEASGTRILLVGCGEIGSRHLQAVVRLPQVTRVEIVDPRPEAWALGRARVADVPDRCPATELRWLSALEEASPGGALCIVATQAEGRSRLVREVAEQLGYRAFLLEKIVTQSVREIEELVAYVRQRELSVWVNFMTRAYPVFQRVKQRLDPEEPIFFSSVGGNRGLATNGMHDADLFACLDGASRIEPAGCALVDPILHPSKRGRTVFDLSGTLHGCTQKGSQMVLSYMPGHAGWPYITIATPRYRWIIDHVQHTMAESDAASGWAWRVVPCECNILVSQMTTVFAAEILAAGRCDLPTLAESLVAHRFILGELQPHFNRLLEQATDLCPVT